MKFFVVFSLFFVLSQSLLFEFALGAENSVTGEWKTIDDETNSPKSIVEIKEEDGKLTGKIVRLFRKADEDQNPKCDKCTGDKKDQPLIGMTILWDMKKKKDTKWDDGTILDPKNGKTYSCKIELLENGKKLLVRGYMGFSLFGRSQTWQRP